MHRVGGGQQRFFPLPGQPQGRGPGHDRFPYPPFAAEEQELEPGVLNQDIYVECEMSFNPIQPSRLLNRVILWLRIKLYPEK